VWRAPQTSGSAWAILALVARRKVAIVSRDPSVRIKAARAFDHAPSSWDVDLYEGIPDDVDAVVTGPDFEEPGAVPLDPEDPARAIAALEARFARGPLLVTGAGRGVGCTTLALHLAAEFGRNGSCCVVGIDPSCGIVERLGLPEDARTYDGGHVWSCALPVATSVRVLLLPADAGEISEAFEKATEAFDRVVVDAPWGTPLNDALALASAAVLVVPPTLGGARRARGVLSRYPDTRWAAVLNRLGPGGETTRSEIENVMSARVALELPCAPSLRDAEGEDRLLLVPWSRWRWRLSRLAVALETA
jgi:hypothetical protein